MTVTNPPHWKEPFLNKGPKYDKIVEMIAAINAAGGIGSHATTHQDSGSDEINVGGLSGELADAQPPKTHDNTAHTTAYEPSNVNIQGHVATPGADAHHPQLHSNTYHSTNYEVANANIQNHVATPAASAHHVKYALTEDLDAAEITQLQNIGTKTISNDQWGYLGGLAGVPITSLHDDSSPQLGADLDLYGRGVLCNNLSANEESGLILSLTASVSITRGHAVYVNASGTLSLADADSTVSMPSIGLALDSVTSSQACRVLIYGVMTLSTWTWTDGGVNGLIYISNNPGIMVQTPPSGTGDQIQVIGHALNATTVFVMPSPVIVEIN